MHFDGGFLTGFVISLQETRRRLEKYVCTISLYADYHFFYYRAGQSVSRALDIMRVHLNKARSVYPQTDFDFDNKVDGVSQDAAVTSLSNS